jgi:hypothetical protein
MLLQRYRWGCELVQLARGHPAHAVVPLRRMAHVVGSNVLFFLQVTKVSRLHVLRVLMRHMDPSDIADVMVVFTILTHNVCKELNL